MKHLRIAITSLVLSVVLIPPVATAQPAARATSKALPVVSMCLGAGQHSDLSYLSVTSRKPSTIIVACPDGGDDDPRGGTGDTYLSDITWKKWNKRTAIGKGTLNLTGMQCIYTSPADGTPSEVQTMCESSGEVGNVPVVKTFDAKIVLTAPKKFKKSKWEFTKVGLTFTNGGPDGKTSAKYRPPRKASE
ncbi:MAG: hypothetical protein OR995_07295 [Candidatus Nanopelagicales bacterium]|nr:hypothetical protein [Candidatus Nanopelagicales bacterium]